MEKEVRYKASTNEILSRKHWRYIARYQHRGILLHDPYDKGITVVNIQIHYTIFRHTLLIFNTILIKFNKNKIKYRFNKKNQSFYNYHCKKSTI